MKLQDPIGLSQALERRRKQSTLRKLTIKPFNSVDFSSNDFLSLASAPELRQAFLDELQSDPALSNLGSGGSRLLDGNSTYAETLERDIAAFHNSPAGLLCNSGFDANVSIFSCLPQPRDIIVYDELIHASVHDGMRQSRAGQCIAFAHNDVSALESVLQRCIMNDTAVQEGQRNVFVAVEAVYSMSGDVAPLHEFLKVMKSILVPGRAFFIVDEAHSTGVFGPKGAGLVCQLGLEDDVYVRLHTFGKALGASGAVILCSETTRNYLINYARPLIYTTFMPYPQLAAIRTSYSFLMQGTTGVLVQHLQNLICALHDHLIAMEASLQLPPHHHHLLRIPHSPPQSAISYVMSSRPHMLAAHCQKEGFWVRGVVPPTVPAGTERVRICLHAGNTVQQIHGLVSAMQSWAQQQLKDTSSNGFAPKL